MKFAIVSTEDTKRILDILKMFDYDIDKFQPDFIITYGGDGTILFAERKYPGIPKITLRKNNGHGSKCLYSEFELEDILLKIENGNYKIIEEIKLVAELNRGVDYIYAGEALNEIQIHNAIPIKSIRFSVEIAVSAEEAEATTENLFGPEVIGDGVIIATPFGSTAYYKSVGGEKFDRGIGIALNNPYNVEREAINIDERSDIIIKILREEGFLLFDNDNKIIPLEKGDKIIVRKSGNTAKFVFN